MFRSDAIRKLVRPGDPIARSPLAHDLSPRTEYEPAPFAAAGVRFGAVMICRNQNTIARPALVEGIGFLGGADIQLRFFPAPANHGITFLRTDVPSAEPIPALVEYAVPRGRRTAIASHGVCVEMIEHVMAALAGLQIDNCRVELDSFEPPGCDGSSLRFAESLLEAGKLSQNARREVISVGGLVTAEAEDHRSSIAAADGNRTGLTIGFELDYGANSPIPRQRATFEITPESFMNELAHCRTFLLEEEAEALRAQGLGARLTYRDLIIWGPSGVMDNELRTPDECVRHKILDCVGDLALIGADLHGKIECWRSGHLLNAEIVRRIKNSQSALQVESRRAA